MTDETQAQDTAPEAEFLLTGDEVAESFIGLVTQSDPFLLSTVFSNTVLLFLSRETGNPQEMTAEEFEEVMVGAANNSFDLIVRELERIRDAKVNFAKGRVTPI